MSAAGITFALYVKREGNNLKGKPATSTSYFHHDHLGSIAAISNESGQLIERLAYDPWGKRRNTNGMPDPLDALYGASTDRGYTMHEHLDEMGIVHMNGRIYDPLIGRFMSADPFIQAPGNLQSYNRYAYVLNNPLAYTDPSGYFSLKKFFKSAVKFSIAPTAKNTFNLIASQPGQAQVDRFIMSNQWAYAIGHAAASWFGGPYGAALWSSYYTYQGTGSMTGAVRAGAISWATAQAMSWAGGVGETFGQYGVAHFGAHALVGCVSTVAQGGRCGSGALSGVAGLAGTAFSVGQGKVYGFVISSITGGIGSVLGEGKFVNGAATAAFGYIFNHLQHEGWGRPDTLQDHFDRHGKDFGAKSPVEYARQAKEFRQSALNNTQTDFRIDSDGTLRIYDRATNTFGSYNADGTTKTFYKPAAGARYRDNPIRSTQWGARLTNAGRALRVIRIIGGNLE